jgi:hypothetical protein
MYDLPVYLLDLCIFSYHLHSQTLIWPMDPYYEQMIERRNKPQEKRLRRRNVFMEDVHRHQWLPAGQQPGAGAYHGPGSCMGWTANKSLDPIISRYDRLYPWRPSFTRPNREEEPWIVYNTPVEITDPINQVSMVRYDSGLLDPWPYSPSPQFQPTVKVDTIHQGRAPSSSTSRQQFPATDLLYCFEGGSGGTEVTNAPAWSMMGYALAKEEKVNNQPVYDVFIVFRGSRSGRVRRGQSLSIMGNPDWATDLGLVRGGGEKDPDISRHGSVCRGFRSSLKTILPTLMRALEEIQKARKAPPRYIYVTGHSLGGALAAQFASSILLGASYKPDPAVQDKMPAALKAWPWQHMNLVTFSAPSVGNQTFHTIFDRTLPSLRIWLEGDPITQERWRYPVGIPYKIADSSRVCTLNSHHPYKIRQRLVNDRVGTWFPNTPGSVPAIHPTHIDHADEPWVHCTTFLEVLNYFNNKGRLNCTTLRECLGAGIASNFADEFVRFLELLDPSKTWTVGLINSIKKLTNASIHPLIIPPNIPDHFGNTFKKYLTVCLVLCLISKGEDDVAKVKQIFETTWQSEFAWKEIEEFK